MERPLPPIRVLHEYVVEIRREQFANVYVLATNPEEAAEKADVVYQAGEIEEWDDGDVEVWNVEET